jgi:hypothetical protein
MSILSKHSLLALLAPLALGGSLLAGSAGCNKPTEESCKAALLNMQRLLGTSTVTSATNIGGAVRRCRGASKREAVQCAIDAQTLDQLKACSFYKEAGGDDAAAGSAAAPAGGSGSAATK